MTTSTPKSITVSNTDGDLRLIFCPIESADVIPVPLTKRLSAKDIAPFLNKREPFYISEVWSTFAVRVPLAELATGNSLEYISQVAFEQDGIELHGSIIRPIGVYLNSTRVDIKGAFATDDVVIQVTSQLFPKGELEKEFEEESEG